MVWCGGGKRGGAWAAVGKGVGWGLMAFDVARWDWYMGCVAGYEVPGAVVLS